MSTRKVPPPPPDADLSPFEVGAYLAGHVPEYVVHSIQTGGTTQAERIERHRRYLTPEGFAAWLETEDAKRTDVDPLRVIECSGFGGAMSVEQHEEAFAQIGKPPGIQAANLGVVKVARKAKAERAKELKGASRGGSASNLTGDEKALHIAKAERKRNPGISDRDLAKRIKENGKASVSVGLEALRKKIADWVAEGQIPMSTATAGRKPKRGRN